MTISPTGRHVALTALDKDGFHRLVIVDTSTLQPTVAASFKEANVVNVHWVSDKRLVFGAEEDGDRPISDFIVGNGLYAVDRDGSDFRQLASVDWNWIKGFTRLPQHMLDPTAHFAGTMQDEDSDSIFVTVAKFTDTTREFEAANLLKLDTRTAETTTFQRPGDTWGWAVDPKNEPRIATTKEPGGRFAIQYLDPKSQGWTRLVDFDWLGLAPGAFDPVGFAPDGTFFVLHREGSGTAGLYTFDLKQGKLAPQPLFSVRGFDVQPHLITSKAGGLLGIRYVADGEGTYWFDAKMKELQAKIDKLLPATVNRIDVPYRAEVPLVAVTAFSDTEPGQFFLYDTQSGKLVRLGRSHPEIDSQAMGPREFARIKARDGLDLPVWLTTPKDGKKGARPMVVLVHGGPWVRGGYWRWSPQAQFLASRGYVVLEPEFRGSTGFGFNHFKAGWKQWGKAMQDDVADATKWAIGKGVADPKRICIAGASYGGYATLMGLANDPDLYKCGFEWVGVTDIGLMFDITWSDTTEDVKTYGMKTLIGDPVKDAAQLKATSPIELAARIKQPLLLGYGAQDRRVPLKHGTEFRDAVTKSNPDVEWVVYDDEGHGWWKLKDNVDWWTRVEKFLARNIGDAAKQ